MSGCSGLPPAPAQLQEYGVKERLVAKWRQVQQQEQEQDEERRASGGAASSSGESCCCELECLSIPVHCPTLAHLAVCHIWWVVAGCVPEIPLQRCPAAAQHHSNSFNGSLGSLGMLRQRHLFLCFLCTRLCVTAPPTAHMYHLPRRPLWRLCQQAAAAALQPVQQLQRRVAARQALPDRLRGT